jgi:hypothetical protein
MAVTTEIHTLTITLAATVVAEEGNQRFKANNLFTNAIVHQLAPMLLPNVLNDYYRATGLQATFQKTLENGVSLDLTIETDGDNLG